MFICSALPAEAIQQGWVEVSQPASISTTFQCIVGQNEGGKKPRRIPPSVAGGGRGQQGAPQNRNVSRLKTIRQHDKNIFPCNFPNISFLSRQIHTYVEHIFCGTPPLGPPERGQRSRELQTKRENIHVNLPACAASTCIGKAMV